MKRNAKMKNIEKMCGSYSKEEINWCTNARRKNSFREPSVHMYSACTGSRERVVGKKSVYVGSTTCVQR